MERKRNDLNTAPSAGSIHPSKAWQKMDDRVFGKKDKELEKATPAFSGQRCPSKISFGYRILSREKPKRKPLLSLDKRMMSPEKEEDLS